jgi:hypothetical protein
MQRMTKQRQKLTRMLLFVGLALLIAALTGAVALAARWSPKRTLEDNIQDEPLAFLPTSTSTPTSTPTHTSTPVTPTVAPVIGPPQLVAPALGGTYQSPLTFEWSGYLRAGQTYSVTVRHHESGHVIQSNPLTEQRWTTDLPGEKYGEWRWVVSLIQSGRVVTSSAEGVFWFDPFPGHGGGKTPSPKLTPRPTTTPHPTHAALPTPSSTRLIEAEWPGRMEVGHSDSIRVSLIPSAEGEYVPTLEVTSHTGVAATPIPLGTPGPLEVMRGPEYRAFVVARLDSVAFECSPSEGREYELLGQPQIEWRWACKPDKAGSHSINASIEIWWKPVEGGEGAIGPGEIWSESLPIEVKRYLIPTKPLAILSPISGLLGAVFSAPTLYQRTRERRKKRVSHPDWLRHQLAEARENLLLIEERKSEYVQETDIPLQLIKDERRLLERIGQLERQLEGPGQSTGDKQG